MVRLSAAYSHGEVEADPVAFALQLCGQFYTERFSPSDLQEKYSWLIEFYRAGEQAAEPTANTAASRPDTGPAFDYRCDAPYIVAAFQQAYGIDLTTAKLHWFRFRALFAALPEDTLMAKIMSWRTMDLSEYEGSMRRPAGALCPAAGAERGCRRCPDRCRTRCGIPGPLPALSGCRCPAPTAAGPCPCGRYARPRHPACGSNAKTPPANGR